MHTIALSLKHGTGVGGLKIQSKSTETIPAALNNHQAFGSSKPTGKGRVSARPGRAGEMKIQT